TLRMQFKRKIPIGNKTPINPVRAISLKFRQRCSMSAHERRNDQGENEQEKISRDDSNDPTHIEIAKISVATFCIAKDARDQKTGEDKKEIDAYPTPSCERNNREVVQAVQPQIEHLQHQHDQHGDAANAVERCDVL